MEIKPYSKQHESPGSPGSYYNAEEGPQDRDGYDTKREEDDATSVCSCPDVESNGLLDNNKLLLPSRTRSVDAIIFSSSSNFVQNNREQRNEIRSDPRPLLYNIAEDEEVVIMHTSQDLGCHIEDDVGVEVMPSFVPSCRRMPLDKTVDETLSVEISGVDSLSEFFAKDHSRYGSVISESPTAVSILSDGEMSAATVKMSNTKQYPPNPNAELNMGDYFKAIDNINAALNTVNSRKRVRRRVYCDASPESDYPDILPMAESHDPYDLQHAFKVFTGFVTEKLSL